MQQNQIRKRTVHKKKKSNGCLYLTLVILAIIVGLAVMGFHKFRDTTPGSVVSEPVAVSAETPAVNPVDSSAPIEPETQIPTTPLDPKERVSVQDLMPRADLPTDWKNYLLLGSDARDLSRLDHCDTIIIASINVESGEVKLTSVMRDTVIEIPGHDLQKINAATYWSGDARLMMRLLNENFGMNITEYALVNFAGMANVVDILGGVPCDITKEEMEIINRHIGEIAAYTMDQQYYLANRDQLQLQDFGAGKVLNGIQAVTFSRIRALGDDYQRTERQKAVLAGIATRLKDANIGQLMQVFTSLWSHVQTNVDLIGAVNTAQSVIRQGLDPGKIKTFRLPVNKSFQQKSGKLGSALYDVDYKENAQQLHEFIYGNRFP